MRILDPNIHELIKICRLVSTNFLFRRSRSTINLVSTISTLVILENSAIVDFSLQIFNFQISDLQLRSKSLKKYCRQESTNFSTINKGGVINRYPHGSILFYVRMEFIRQVLFILVLNDTPVVVELLLVSSHKRTTPNC